MELLKAIVEGEMPSRWVIDVWNCHGVLKVKSWGTGYGCEPDIPEAEEYDAKTGKKTGRRYKMECERLPA